MERAYFCAYHNYAEIFLPLSDAARGRLFMACLAYSHTGEEVPLAGPERYAFPALKGQIDRDKLRWQVFDAKQAERGKKGGRPRKGEETRKNPENPPLFLKTQKSQEIEKEKEIDTDTEIEIDKEIDTDTEIDTEKETDPAAASAAAEALAAPAGAGAGRPARCVPPQESQVLDYFLDQDSTAREADAFWDYYTSNGWRVGKNPMKDWKAAARGWMRRAAGVKASRAPQQTEGIDAQFARVLGHSWKGDAL